MPPEALQLHASCIAIHDMAILLLGESGSGKSDLALRLIDGGATLVGDDQVLLTKNGDALLASPASNIEGLLEARGIGILRLPYVSHVPVALAVALVAPTDIERMPEPQFFDCLGLQLPLLSLHAFESSAPARIRFYLSHRS